ncbi:FAD/NAD(P)-binding protein [Streptomyces acidiscabies]|uniref:FAD/NAD(P)-binding protein n=1 Tax=Streptomyces acidiscabies TaxID=42234 RepID=UPI000952CE8F|nr:FAD/NAD(P)-binding protein [Streptomyces acidiscabies]
MTPHRVLQIGCGPTGTSLLRQLLPRTAGLPVRYEVADPAPMGPGLAFSTPYDLHLLNVRADRMSLHPHDKGEFARRRTDAGPADYPPRRLFGSYARAVLADTLRTAPEPVRLTGDRVVEVRRTAGGWRCRFACGRAASYDTVVLTLGHLPSAPYAPAEGRAGFLRDPWHGLDLPRRARVGVVGTRLTGVDTALALRERGHEGPVLLASRSGRLPSVKGRVAAYELAYLPTFVTGRQPGSVTLAQIARAIAREVRDAEGGPVSWTRALNPPPASPGTLRAELAVAESGRVIGWQSVLAAVVPWVPTLWRLLDAPGRHLLMSAYVGAWAVRIASFPAVSARRLLEMMEDGRLTVRPGLVDVVPAGSGYLMRFGDGRAVRVDAVVNATGPGYGRASLDATELTRSLWRSGTTAVHPFGGFAVDERTFEAGPGLHVVGDLTRGVWLATNAVENSVRQSVLLAEVLARRMLSGSCRSRRSPDT